MDRFIRIDSHHKLHYLEFGSGEPLILVPSLWVTSESYERLGRALGKHYHTYIPDIYRGKSEFSSLAQRIDDYAAILAQFIRQLHFSSFHLLGISLSGMTVLKYVRTYKAKPKKIFLLSTTVLPFTVTRRRLSMALAYVRLLYHNSFSREGIAINALWIRDGLKNAGSHFRQALAEGEIAVSLVIEDIKSLPVPTKLLFASKDEFFPLASVKQLSTVKNLTVEIINGYHGWFFRHEAVVVKKMVDFFDAR